MEHADHKRIRGQISSPASAAMYRPSSVKNKELMTLYEGDGESFDQNEDSTSEEDLEGSEEGKGGKGYRSSLSLEIYGLRREQQVYFSNQEYYTRLEELKRAHLRNMADLEKMYISQEGYDRGDDGEDGLSISFGAARKLQRINSQEELDFHDSSSSSDYSELYSGESVGELELDGARRTEQEQYASDDALSPEDMMFQPRRTSQRKPGTLSRQTVVSVRPTSKVTVPKPFQMMLREEERKRHKVRTRSEIELENTLLRQELEELQECQKKFRASPAPAHIHLPLYEVIGQRTSQSRSVSGARRNQGSPTAPGQPFTFLERERRKKEAKIVAELGRPGSGEERQVFKARPVPRSVYAGKHATAPTSRRPKFLNVCVLEKGVTEARRDPSPGSKRDSFSDPYRPQKYVKKQLELSIELVKGSELQQSAV